MRFALLAVLCALPVLLGAGVPEPEGFRMDHYDAPVPESIAGGRVVDAEALAAAMAHGAIAIDVVPAQRRPEGVEDSAWLPIPHRNIPGSLWWPEAGRGAISPVLDAWFRKRLTEVTGGDRGKAIAFYCKTECWLGWNAAKRAILYGYGQVLWFPDGPEGWEVEGYKLVLATPEAVPVQ